MIDMNSDWLPLGSVVRLDGGERLLMIAGFMAINSEDGKAYDYVGYPYPEGKQVGQELFFERSSIESIHHMGYQSSVGLLFWKNLELSEDSYRTEKARRLSAAGH